VSNSVPERDPFVPWEVWNRDDLRVAIRRTSSGGVQFDIREREVAAGLRSEREYAVGLSDDQHWDLIDVLGGKSDDPLELIAANIDVIVASGIENWLASHGLYSGGRYPIEPHRSPVMASTSREIWAQNGLYVSIARTVDGGLRFEGQDLNPNPFGSSEYEYALAVQRADVLTIVTALGGAADADPLELIAANAETIVRAGEMSWLKSLGIEPAFWSRS
jgi:hypothetical protein